MGRMTLAQPLIDAGLLVTLSDERLPSPNAHWLVYPARSSDHKGLTVFRTWVLAQASEYAQSLLQGRRDALAAKKASKPTESRR